MRVYSACRFSEPGYELTSSVSKLLPRIKSITRAGTMRVTRVHLDGNFCAYLHLT